MSNALTLAELVAIFREDTDDHGDLNGNGGLWSNALVTRYLNEAQDEAAIRARLLFDTTQTIDVAVGTSVYAFTALFEITRMDRWQIVVAGDPTADPVVPPTYALRGCKMDSVSQDWLDDHYPDWRIDCRPPEWFIQNDTSITFPGQFQHDFQARMSGYRTPLAKMAKGTDVPEINPTHHQLLVKWALYRAYAKPDSEAFNPQKSATALAEFEDYFGYRPKANQNERNQADRDHHVRAYP